MINAMRALVFTLCALVCAHPALAQDNAGFVDRLAHIDGGRWRLSDGWSNGDWIDNDWRARQISNGAGGAAILLSAQHGAAKPFSSGEMQTNGVYQHGYFEARLQAPRGSGVVTGFFTYTREGDDQSTWDEIDVEILGRDTSTVQFTYFHGGARRSATVPLGFDAASGLHTYAFDWQTDHLRWYVDGVMRHEEVGDALPLPTRAQRLFVNLWNSSSLTDWLGPIDGHGPWMLHVACVAQADQAPARPLCR